MSTLLVDELFNNVVVEQPFKITRRTNLAYIRMWIYRNNDLLTGSLRMRIYDGATLLAEDTLTIAEINAAFTQPYAHGFLRFDFDALVLNITEGASEKEYKIQVQMVGHTTNASNFIGLVRRYEAKTYDTYGAGVINNESPSDTTEPFGIELFEYKTF